MTDGVTGEPVEPVDPIDPDDPIEPDEPRTLVATWVREVLAGTSLITFRADLSGHPVPDIPAGWLAPDPETEPVTLDPAQPFGPLHALVVARGQQVLWMDARGALEFPHRTVCAAHVGWPPGEALAVAEQAAARSGRSGQLAEAVRAGEELLVLLEERPEEERSWWQLRMPYPTGVLPSGGQAARAAVRELCREGLLALLATSTVADLLPAPVRVRCQGPWEWAVNGGQAPEPEWIAPPAAVDAVRELLDSADDSALTEAAGRFTMVRDSSEYRELMVRLDGYRTLGPCSPPRDRRILRAGRAVSLPEVVAGDAEQLGRELLTALTMPAEARAEVWAPLTAPFRPALPELWEQPPLWDGTDSD